MFNGKTHYKWPFSIAMLVYRRVIELHSALIRSNDSCHQPIASTPLPLWHRLRQWLSQHPRHSGHRKHIETPQKAKISPYYPIEPNMIYNNILYIYICILIICILYVYLHLDHVVQWFSQHSSNHVQLDFSIEPNILKKSMIIPDVPNVLSENIQQRKVHWENMVPGPPPTSLSLVKLRVLRQPQICVSVFQGSLSPLGPKTSLKTIGFPQKNHEFFMMEPLEPDANRMNWDKDVL